MLVTSYPQVTLIFRNAASKVVHWVCETVAACNYNFAIELTLNSANAFELSSFIQKYPTIKFGAGTVLDLNGAKLAINAGVKFVLSPIVLDDEVFDYCKLNSILIVSGAYTPTEIWKAYKKGSDIVKVFPARDLSSNYIHDVKAPLGNIPLMAVGGVSPANLRNFFNNGFDYVGMGTGLFGKGGAEITLPLVEAKLNDLHQSLTSIE